MNLTRTQLIWCQLTIIIALVLAVVPLLRGQGQPVCGDIFPPEDLVVSGERLRDVRYLEEVTLFPRNNRLWVEFEGEPPAWLLSPYRDAPYHWYKKQKSYCRSEGHSDACFTDCFTIRGIATTYTVASSEGDAWDTIALTWGEPWGQK